MLKEQQRFRTLKKISNLALEAAREGIVLLKNDILPGKKNKILPLSKNIRSIAVIGPNADDEKNQLGDYTPNCCFTGYYYCSGRNSK